MDFMRIYEQFPDKLIDIREEHCAWNNSGGLSTCFNERHTPYFFKYTRASCCEAKEDGHLVHLQQIRFRRFLLNWIAQIFS